MFVPFGLLMAGVICWALRLWIKSLIEKGTQAAYDRRIEALRSSLRAREATLTGLQTALLHDRSGKLAALEQRRLQALEAIWAEVVRLRPALMPAMLLRILKLDAVAERSQSEPKLRDFVNIARGEGTVELFRHNAVDLHQPFVDQTVWANFTAYRTVLMSAAAIVEMIIMGAGDARNFVSEASVTDVVKAALPGSISYLDRVGSVGAYYLIDQLETLVLDSLRAAIEGAEADEEAVARAHRIMELARKAEEKRVAATAGDLAQ